MANITISTHALIRAKQRGRKPDEINFIVEHGDRVDGGYLMSCKAAAELEQEARRIMELARRLRGAYVPVTHGVVKTIFKATRRQQARLL